ncbi:hypothetical protein L7F22_003844 [Adiantum nelumboides]|nr:hypothetical protein [Adiantum nelumboides]
MWKRRARELEVEEREQKKSRHRHRSSHYDHHPQKSTSSEGLLQLTMGESTGEPAEGAKEQSSSREQLSGQALGMEKVGDKRPTTASVEALSDAPEDLLSKCHKKRRLVRGQHKPL